MTPDAWLPRRQRAPAPSLQSARSSSSPRWGWWWWWWRGWDGTWWQQGPCQRWQQDRRFPLNLESEASCESPCHQLWRRGPRRSCWRHWRVEKEVERVQWSVGAGGRTWSAQLREAATQGTRNTWEAQKIEMESIFSNSSVELKGSPHTKSCTHFVENQGKKNIWDLLYAYCLCKTRQTSIVPKENW